MSELYELFSQHPRISTDTRRIEPDSIFFALRGDTFDGNRFVAEALEKGAAYAVSDDPQVAASDERQRIVLVDDTLKALQDLARCHRRALGIPILAISGSNGKTTTKELVSRVLAERFEVYATRGNLNNHIGVPMMLLRFDRETKVAVIEAGISHPGEMAKLVSWIRPTVTVITNAQREHQEFLDGVEASARENAFAIVALSAKGKAVLPQKDACLPLWLDYARARGCQVTRYCEGASPTADLTTRREGDKLIIQCKNTRIETTLAISGKHAEHDAAAAAAAALAAGVTPEAVSRGLARFEALPGRGRRHQLAGGALLIDDSYNANPDSMRAAIDVLAAQPAPRVLVAGDMAETGEQHVEFHAEIGRYAKQKGIDRFLATGPDMAHAVQAFGAAGRHYDATDMLLRAVREAVRTPASVLVKASHSQRLDRVVESLLKDPGTAQ